MKTYQHIARLLAQLARCESEEANESQKSWAPRVRSELAEFIKQTSPHGSGIDCGTKLDDASTSQKLIFKASLHHMNDNGFYDGWTHHQIIVKPCLEFDFSIRINGQDRNQCKDDLHEVYDIWLREEVKASMPAGQPSIA